MTPALHEQCEQAMHVVLPAQHRLRGGRACLYILRVIGYRRTAAVFSLWPLSWVVDLGYDIVAAVKGYSCIIVMPEGMNGYDLVARNRLLFSRFLFTRD